MNFLNYFYEYLINEERKTRYSNSALKKIRQLGKESLGDDEALQKAVESDPELKKIGIDNIKNRLNSINVETTYKGFDKDNTNELIDNLLNPSNSKVLSTKDGKSFYYKSAFIDKNMYLFQTIYDTQEVEENNRGTLPLFLYVKERNGEKYNVLFKINLRKKEVIKPDDHGRSLVSHRENEDGKLIIVKEVEEFLGIFLRALSKKIKEKEPEANNEYNEIKKDIDRINNEISTINSEKEKIETKLKKEKEKENPNQSIINQYTEKLNGINSELAAKQDSLNNKEKEKDSLYDSSYYSYGPISLKDIQDDFEVSYKNHRYSFTDVSGYIKGIILELSKMGLHDALFTGDPACNPDGDNIDKDIFNEETGYIKPEVKEIIQDFCKNHNYLQRNKQDVEASTAGDIQDLSIHNSSKVFQMIERAPERYINQEQKNELKNKIKEFNASEISNERDIFELNVFPEIKKMVEKNPNISIDEIINYLKGRIKFTTSDTDSEIKVDKSKIYNINSYDELSNYIKTLSKEIEYLDKEIEKNINDKTDSTSEIIKKNKKTTEIEKAESVIKGVNNLINKFNGQYRNDDGSIDIEKLEDFENVSKKWQNEVIVPFLYYLIVNVVEANAPKNDDNTKENMAFAIDKSDTLNDEDFQKERSEEKLNDKNSAFKEVVKRILTNNLNNNVDLNKIIKKTVDDSLEAWGKESEDSNKTGMENEYKEGSNARVVSTNMSKTKLYKQYGRISETDAADLVYDTVKDLMTEQEDSKTGKIKTGYGDVDNYKIQNLAKRCTEAAAIRYMYSGDTDRMAGEVDENNENSNYKILIEQPENTNWYSFLNNKQIFSPVNILEAIINGITNTESKKEETKEETDKDKEETKNTNDD